VSTQVQLLHGSLADVTGQYNLILANLLSSILLRMVQEEKLAARLRSGGRLVAAGILEEQAEPLIAAFQTAGLQLIAQPQYEDWVALVVQRPN
jgi:ribosomal protein L11 methyltransferase